MMCTERFISALERRTLELQLVTDELLLTGGEAGFTDEMARAVALAPVASVTPRELWRWYRLYQFPSWDEYEQMVKAAAYYADKEGLCVGTLILERARQR